MTMFKRFIVATDLSPASTAVATCLGALKVYGAEQCLLLQCLTISEAASTAISYNTEPIKGMLKEQKTILENEGFAVEARTVVGSPKNEVTRIANEEDYSLIVLGAQGHSLVRERLLGGVAYGIINQSKKPVLVVPVEKKPGDGDQCEPVTRCNFQKEILFATDFSQMADNAFTYVEQFVANGAGKVTLIHVQDKVKLEKHTKEQLEEFDRIDRRRLDALKESLLKKGDSDIDVEVCHGLPFQEITHLIQERNVQLAVMGTQGRSFAGKFFLGNVSQNVARHSVAPVLLIPMVK